MLHMKQEYDLYNREMYKKWGIVSPEVMPGANTANNIGNAKKVAA